MPCIILKSPLYNLILHNLLSKDPVISFCYLLIFVCSLSVLKSDLQLLKRFLSDVLFIDTTMQKYQKQYED